MSQREPRSKQEANKYADRQRSAELQPGRRSRRDVTGVRSGRLLSCKSGTWPCSFSKTRKFMKRSIAGMRSSAELSRRPDPRSIAVARPAHNPKSERRVLSQNAARLAGLVDSGLDPDEVSLRGRANPLPILLVREEVQIG